MRSQQTASEAFWVLCGFRKIVIIHSICRNSKVKIPSTAVIQYLFSCLRVGCAVSKPESWSNLFFVTMCQSSCLLASSTQCSVKQGYRTPIPEHLGQFLHPEASIGSGTGQSGHYCLGTVPMRTYSTPGTGYLSAKVKSPSFKAGTFLRGFTWAKASLWCWPVGETVRSVGRSLHLLGSASPHPSVQAPAFSGPGRPLSW